VSLSVPKPLKTGYPTKLQTLGEHLRRRRLDLGLLQQGVAQIIGTTKDTVYNWEGNRTNPSLKFIPKVRAFLGYIPFDSQPKTLGEKILVYRLLLGISRKKLAHTLGVDPTTLAKWEQGKSTPVARSLEIIDQLFRVLPH
jgi:transcriptional regulator with XRE-family HTH domain